MKQVLKKMRIIAAVIPAIILSFSSNVKAQFDGGVEDLPVVKVIGTANGGLINLAANAWVDNTFQPGYEQSKKIINIVRLSLFEETNKYLSADFTVTVPVKIQYGPNASTLYEYNHNFTVSYSKAEGVKYNAKNYFSFENAAYVKITLTGDPSPLSAGGVNMADILLVENEMRVTRYYDLQPGITPIYLSGPSSVFNPVDVVGVSWLWPANTGNNGTQLEWTWLEDELEQYYYVNGSLNIDLLFRDNATRVDLPYNTNSFNIPLFYDGQGKLYYRIRPVNFQSNGSRIDGQWTTPYSGSGICSYGGHNNALNWQVRTSFAEEGKLKSVMEYYDGSLRSRQTVTKENVNNTTIYAETLYDYEGRPAIQILPSPGINTVIKYQAGLNLFNGTSGVQTLTQNHAEFFDLSPVNGSGSALYATASLSTSTGTSRYYSSSNDEINIGPNKNIPDAEGYPYTVTRYMPDATGRILGQSGVGPAHKMGSTRETKYYYGSPAQEELDGLFGTEVGNKTHYFKNMVKDANGQMSVSYVDMHGRTIATALAGEAPGNLLALNINDPVHYPNQAGSTITRNLLDARTNIVKGNTIESISTFLVPATTGYSFSYNLAPDKLQLSSCTSQPLCYDCLYDLEISITDESGDVAPYLWKFTNVSLEPDQACSTATPALQLVSGTDVNIVGNTINFTKVLPPGSYSVRKTLTLSEASLAKYKSLYLTPGTGLCKTEQEIIDSVYNVLVSTSNCGAPVSPTCQSCLNELGTYPQFENAYLASIGNPPLTTELQREIQAAYDAGVQNCNSICNTTSQLIASKREIMLADMMPYGGQYATGTPAPPPIVPGLMFNKYNIFSTAYNAGIQPYYKKPEPQNGTGGRYRDNFGNLDTRIHPDNTWTYLNGLSPDDFANIFVNSWAEALLPYHPEYPRLQFVETNLANNNVNIYNWITTFGNTTTYANAVSAGYIYTSAAGTDINDNFYNIAPSSYRTTMGGWIANNYAGTNYSLWQIARGQMRCQNDPNKPACFNNGGVKVPPFAGFSNADYDQLWQNFRGLYMAARDNQVNQYIVQQVPLTDEASLIGQGFQIRFTTNNNVATQYGWTWFPPVVGNPPPVIPPVTPGTTYQSRCESYISQWRTSLLQCAVLNTHPNKEQILTDIMNGMVSVCVRGSDAANPQGSSTVAPSQVSQTLPNSFEQVIYNVFTTNGIPINTRDNYYCNPYVIEFPKPYGKNPRLIQEYTTQVDSCACAHFDSLKIRVTQAGYNPYNLISLNTYLQLNSMDTLTQVLHTALLGCSGYRQWVCDYEQQWVDVSCYDPNPCTIDCVLKNKNKQSRSGDAGTDGPSSCSEWNFLISCFYDSYGQLINSNGNCQTYFVQFYNGWYYPENLTWSQIAAAYQASCGQTLNVCTPCITSVLCNVETNCRWEFVPHILSSPQPLPEYLKCGGWPPKNRCLTCDSLVVRTTEFKTKFDPPINNGPIFTGTNLTQDQIDQNILYARFLNFRTGFQFTWIQYAKAAADANCNPYGGGGGTTDLTVTTRSGNTPQQYIASNSITFDPNFDHPVGDDYETLLQPNGGGGPGGPQTVICRDNRPLTDTTGYFVIDTPCHRIRVMAISLGQEIYQMQQQTILANFEKAYREKCMAAKNYESFTATYTNKEYHYTLYYYDMAGSLVKTVPPKGVRPDFSTSFTNSVVAARAVDGYIPRPHEYVTQYRYNSLGGVVAKNSPDDNTTKSWYDKLGRSVVSQDAQQALENKYSYTLYDPLGRITEAGQKPQTTPMTQTISQDDVALNNWIVSNGGTREQITYSVYDLPYLFNPPNPPGLYPLLAQQNLRNRVSYSATKNLATDAMHYTATFYTYDIHGNVDTLIQDYNGITEMQSTNNRFKMIAYDYDLISGKVNMVSYQPDWYNTETQQWVRTNDKFFHRYKYDAENRLIQVWSSRDKIEWERDAAYSYYKYGQLSRTELGKLQVQGTDYAYTIRGWLKAVNSTTVGDGTYDIGYDGLTSGGNSVVARDVYGFSLHYFDDGNNEMDYKPISGPAHFARPNNNAFKSLYNGNIGAMSVNNAGLLKGPSSTTNALPLFYNYRYDQLNRIRTMNAFMGLQSNNTWQPVSINDYTEAVTYDPNGNILTYNRKGSPSVSGNQTEMDDLTYSYYSNMNQLQRVNDNPAYNSYYSADIDNQTTTNNYTYDAIGNLKTDAAEGIANINWTAYGKIGSVIKSESVINYSYDAASNRITKKVLPELGAAITTVYVRDANGNVMAIYEKEGGGAVQKTEDHIYGSSRIGILNKLTVTSTTVTLESEYGAAIISTFTRGEKNYELSNHLGNVLVTVTDKKIQYSTTSIVEYYKAEIVSAMDYYPFGMTVPGRKYISQGYRYGFSGKEKDNDISVDDYDFGGRIYDGRIARWLSTDPLQAKLPGISPYNYCFNSPTNFIDPDGNLSIHVIVQYDAQTKTYSLLSIAVDDDLMACRGCTLKNRDIGMNYYDYWSVTVVDKDGNTIPGMGGGGHTFRVNNWFAGKWWAKQKVNDGVYESGGGIMWTSEEQEGTSNETRKGSASAIANLDAVVAAVGGMHKLASFKAGDMPDFLEMLEMLTGILEEVADKGPNEIDFEDPEIKKATDKIKEILAKFNIDPTSTTTPEAESESAVVKGLSAAAIGAAATVAPEPDKKIYSGPPDLKSKKPSSIPGGADSLMTKEQAIKEWNEYYKRKGSKARVKTDKDGNLYTQQ